MTREELKNILYEIKPLNKNCIKAATERQAALVKPPGSLGRLEDISIKLSGIRETLTGDMKKQAIVIMSSDNGVCREGVASAPQSVTKAQTINFLRRLTGVGSMAKYFNIDLLVTDVGIKEDIPKELYAETASVALTDNKIWNRKIRRGTRNLAVERAMTEEELLLAVKTGIEAAQTIKAGGYDIFGVGEMGIGNTTTSAAVLSALLGLPAEDTVGKGGGLKAADFIKKRQLVADALERYTLTVKAGSAETEAFGVKAGNTGNEVSGDRAGSAENGVSGEKSTCDVIDILGAVGGYDIAAMTGAYLGAAIYRLPVVIDGYISAVAALCAERLYQELCIEDGIGDTRPVDEGGELAGGADHTETIKISDFMFSSHKSFEKGYMLAMEALGLEPIFDLRMRLGEGSGCPIAFKVLEAAQGSFELMGTFAEAEINDEYLEEIRKEGSF